MPDTLNWTWQDTLVSPESVTSLVVRLQRRVHRLRDRIRAEMDPEAQMELLKEQERFARYRVRLERLTKAHSTRTKAPGPA